MSSNDDMWRPLQFTNGLGISWTIVSVLTVFLTSLAPGSITTSGFSITTSCFFSTLAADISSASEELP